MAACSDSHSRELCNRLQSHIEILEYAIVRLSGKAELCGAAQQVSLLSSACCIMLHLYNSSVSSVLILVLHAVCECVCVCTE
jgi:hypothetical protein